MSRPVNWGIIGLGKIARKFADDLRILPDARLIAVASSSLGRAQAFAQEYALPHAYGSYEELLECPDLDVVYVATPHHLHYANTMMCLERGIGVLCEKPLAINAVQVKAMIAKAQEKNTFLMEALWTRFLPLMDRVDALLEEQAIGRILSIKADFGFEAHFESRSRLFDPEMGGGALLDIGIYPVFLAYALMGIPANIKSFAHIGPTGVDEEIGILFEYDSGQMAHLHASLRSHTKTEAFIYGDEGTIHIHRRWHEGQQLTVFNHAERPRDFFYQSRGKGYCFEADEVVRCIQAGQSSSAKWTHQDSLNLMTLLDRIRKEAGISYREDKIQQQ